MRSTLNPAPARHPRIRPISWVGPVALALLLGIGCSSETPSGSNDSPSPEEPSQAQEATLTVTEVQAMLPPGGHGALYFTVQGGSEPDRLLRVETTSAASAEIHETLEEDGVMKMVARPDGFEIPAGGQLIFEPGGKHVMLMDPSIEESAQDIEVTLYFEHTGATNLRAPLVALGAAEDHSAHSMPHHHAEDSQADDHAHHGEDHGNPDEQGDDAEGAG